MRKKPKTFGQQVAADLRAALRHMRAGKPARQAVVRRMTVKGETVFVHEAFDAPLGPPRQKETPPG